MASLGVLLSLMAGVSRSAFAMAATRNLPSGLDAVHPTHRVPHRAGVAVAGLVLVAWPWREPVVARSCPWPFPSPVSRPG